jgi:hypothetical protein
MGVKSLAMGGDMEGFAKWLESNGAKVKERERW